MTSSKSRSQRLIDATIVILMLGFGFAAWLGFKAMAGLSQSAEREWNSLEKATGLAQVIPHEFYDAKQVFGVERVRLVSVGLQDATNFVRLDLSKEGFSHFKGGYWSQQELHPAERLPQFPHRVAWLKSPAKFPIMIAGERPEEPRGTLIWLDEAVYAIFIADWHN